MYDRLSGQAARQKPHKPRGTNLSRGTGQGPTTAEWHGCSGLEQAGGTHVPALMSSGHWVWRWISSPSLAKVLKDLSPFLLFLTALLLSRPQPTASQQSYVLFTMYPPLEPSVEAVIRTRQTSTTRNPVLPPLRLGGCLVSSAQAVSCHTREGDGHCHWSSSCVHTRTCAHTHRHTTSSTKIWEPLRGM